MIKSLSLSLLLASSTAQQIQTRSERIEFLSQFFSPQFNEYVEVDPKLEKERKYHNKAYKLKGWIEVNPPKNTCFTIMTSETKKDTRVCQKSDIPFYLEDINGKGEIVWTISTGPNDFGTKVHWKTPYRVGSYVDKSMEWPGPSKDILVKGCKVLPHRKDKEKIEIEFFNNKKWLVYLPDQKISITQPKKDTPHLFVQKSKSASSFKSLRGGQKKKKNNSPIKVLEYDNFIKFNWQIHPRNAYYLPPEKMILDFSLPPGKAGACIYKYYGYKHDASVGAIECQDIDDYNWFYLPLICLKRKSD